MNVSEMKLGWYPMRKAGDKAVLYWDGEFFGERKNSTGYTLKFYKSNNWEIGERIPDDAIKFPPPGLTEAEKAIVERISEWLERRYATIAERIRNGEWRNGGA